MLRCHIHIDRAIAGGLLLAVGIWAVPAPAAEIPAPTPAPIPALEAAPIEAATVEVWYLRRGLPLHEQLSA